MQCVTSHPLVQGLLRSRSTHCSWISAYISCRGPKREIQSNPASYTHTPNTTDSYSCYSAEFSFTQVDLCEKHQIIRLCTSMSTCMFHRVKECLEQSIFPSSYCSEVVVVPWNVCRKSIKFPYLSCSYCIW